MPWMFYAQLMFAYMHTCWFCQVARLLAATVGEVVSQQQG